MGAERTEWEMMKEYSRERRNQLEPERFAWAQKKLIDLGYETEIIGKEIRFTHKGETVKFFPFTGWFTGKSVKDGRGVNNLLKQLKS